MDKIVGTRLSFTLRALDRLSLSREKRALMWHRLLVITLVAVGDLVVCLPTFRALKKSFPKAYIALMVTPILGIFGPSDPRLVTTGGENHLAVWRNVPCSPCCRPDTVRSRDDFAKYPQGTLQCMNEISVEEVLASCNQLMQRVSHTR